MTDAPTTGPLDAWLASVMPTLNAAQRARLDDAISQTAAASDAERMIVLTTTVNYMTGQVDVDKAGTALKAARVMEIRARMAAKQIAKLAIEDGATEHGTAKKLGVDRMAIRKWLGKK